MLHLTPNRIHSLLSPKDPSPVDMLNFFSNAVGFPEIMNRGATLRNSAIVVYYHIAAQRNSVIEVTQNLEGRLVHISINTKHRDRGNRSRRECIFEPSDQELHSVIQQFVSPEVLLDLFQRNAQVSTQLPMPIACVCRIPRGVRRGKPLKGV